MTTAPLLASARQAILAAAARPEVRHAIDRIYADLQLAIETRRPICSASGRCCRFETYGHRLYVTTLELAAFVAQLPQQDDPLRVWDGQGCPFQVAGLCGVHAIRPFGCRIFFCDPTATQWQEDQYARFHAQIKTLHEELQVPYFYLEWRQALQAVLPALGADRAKRPQDPAIPRPR